MPIYGKIIVIKRNGSDGSVFPVTKFKTSIGKNENSDIRVQLPNVAFTHCSIIVNDNGEAFLENLSPKHPTLLCGRRLDNAISIKLKHGDVFTVADRSFRFENAVQQLANKTREDFTKLLHNSTAVDKDQNAAERITFTTPQGKPNEQKASSSLKSKTDAIKTKPKRKIEETSKTKAHFRQSKVFASTNGKSVPAPPLPRVVKSKPPISASKFLHRTPKNGNLARRNSIENLPRNHRKHFPPFTAVKIKQNSVLTKLASFSAKPDFKFTKIPVPVNVIFRKEQKLGRKLSNSCGNLISTGATFEKCPILPRYFSAKSKIPTLSNCKLKRATNGNNDGDLNQIAKNLADDFLRTEESPECSPKKDLKSDKEAQSTPLVDENSKEIQNLVEDLKSEVEKRLANDQNGDPHTLKNDDLIMCQPLNDEPVFSAIQPEACLSIEKNLPGNVEVNKNAAESNENAAEANFIVEESGSQNQSQIQAASEECRRALVNDKAAAIRQPEKLSSPSFVEEVIVENCTSPKILATEKVQEQLSFDDQAVVKLEKLPPGQIEVEFLVYNSEKNSQPSGKPVARRTTRRGRKKSTGASSSVSQPLLEEESAAKNSSEDLPPSEIQISTKSSRKSRKKKTPASSSQFVGNTENSQSSANMAASIEGRVTRSMSKKLATNVH